MNVPGFDPIIGQTNDETDRNVAGVDPTKPPDTNLTLPMEWVVPKGGEYFFSPSIPVLKTKFALPA